jgi:phage-related protein
MMFDVQFYTLPDGRCPVKECLKELSPKMRAKALSSIQILEEYGNTLREPYSKHLGDGLMELRIKFSSDIARIFYFFVIGNQIILTNGFIKKTQKTPKEQIELARKYKHEYERSVSYE